MRFAITAVDRFLPVFEGLLRDGWRPLKLFTVPPNTPASQNKVTIDQATGLGIPIQLSRMDDADLKELGEQGCEVLVCASYDWRIGDWRPYIPYAINFHPSPLPDARGPYPAFRAILEQRRSWAVTCHKLEQKFDSGDIIAAEPFALSELECHESLDLKVQMAAGRLARRVAQNLPELWSAAEPQHGGSYWKRSTDADRTLDFSGPVEVIMRQVRAFGLIETLAQVNGSTVHVRRAVGWIEAHRHTPGVVVHAQARQLVVAAKDGYIALLEWSLVPLAAADAIGRTMGPLAGG